MDTWEFESPRSGKLDATHHSCYTIYYGALQTSTGYGCALCSSKYLHQLWGSARVSTVVCSTLLGLLEYTKTTKNNNAK